MSELECQDDIDQMRNNQHGDAPSEMSDPRLFGFFETSQHKSNERCDVSGELSNGQRISVIVYNQLEQRAGIEYSGSVDLKPRSGQPEKVSKHYDAQES